MCSHRFMDIYYYVHTLECFALEIKALWIYVWFENVWSYIKTLVFLLEINVFYKFKLFNGVTWLSHASNVLCYKCYKHFSNLAWKSSNKLLIQQRPALFEQVVQYLRSLICVLPCVHAISQVSSIYRALQPDRGILSQIVVS